VKPSSVCIQHGDRNAHYHSLDVTGFILLSDTSFTRLFLSDTVFILRVSNNFYSTSKSHINFSVLQK
jgi:hypothetical protein